MTAMLKAEGLKVNRKRVQRLMRKMGVAALGPKPNTTACARPQDLSLSVAQQQVWAADITYLPIGRSFSISSRSSTAEAPNSWQNAQVILEPCGVMSDWVASNYPWQQALQWAIDNHAICLV
jgi:transposase InsO family protein